MDRDDDHRHFLSGKSIVIAGAGIAGLSYAIAITKFWNDAAHGPRPALQIFERDDKESSIGREGYSLSLRSDNNVEGLQALQKLDLLDAMIDASITGIEHKGFFSIWNKDWKPVMQIGARLPERLPVGSLRIARNKLRKVLVDATYEQPSAGLDINWGRWCTGTREAEGGRIIVEINDGTTIDCDLLVAADGASSKLRASLRPEDTLHFTGISAITANSRWKGSPPSPIDKDWGLVVSANGISLFASPVDDHSAVWSLSWREKQPRQAVKFSQVQGDIDLLMKEAKNKGSWLPPLWNNILESTDTKTLWLMNAMDKQPFDHASATPKRVIFIGDANHAVSPFAGAGANLAIMDGFDLAISLLHAPSLEEGVKAYDAKAVPRAKKVLSMSHFAIGLAHSKGVISWVYMWTLRLMYWLFLKKYVELQK